MEKKSDAIHSVVDAAAILQISEFELFQLAYQNWFGREAEPQVLESYFHQYLFKTTVPPWVRDFVRRFPHLYREAGLPPSSTTSILPRAETRPRPLLGGLAFILIMLILGLLVHLALRAENSMLKGCHLPPCYQLKIGKSSAEDGGMQPPVFN